MLQSVKLHTPIKHFKKLLLTLVVILFGLSVGPLYLQRAGATGSASLYLSPGSSSVRINNNIVLAIYTGVSGASVVTVEAHLQYDSAKLQLASIDTSGTHFETTAEKTSTSSAINVVVGTATPVTGTQLVARLTFKALASSGTSSISFDQSSSGVYDSVAANNILSSVTNGSYSFTTPPPPPPGGGGSGGSSGGSGSSSGTTKSSGGSTSKTTTTTTAITPKPNPKAPQNTTSSDTTAPKIKTLPSLEVGYNSADVKLTASEPVKLIISYGFSQELGLTVATKNYSTTPKISIDNTNLIPGRTFYYQLQVVDTSGNITKGELKSFKTKGYTVSVTFQDKKKHGIANLKVNLQSELQTATTNSKGIATFTDVEPGKHTVKTTVDNKPYSQQIVVADTLGATTKAVDAKATAAAQSFVVKTNKAGGPTIWQVLVLILLVLLTAGGALYLFLLQRKNNNPGSGTPDADLSTGPTDYNQQNVNSPTITPPETPTTSATDPTPQVSADPEQTEVGPTIIRPTTPPTAEPDSSTYGNVAVNSSNNETSSIQTP